jgi:redox-sensitive bicupin YhaK (pirin superfamily)
LINKRIISNDHEEDFSYLKTKNSLSTSIKDMNIENLIKELKNITLVPRSGTHNNFKIKEEVIMYVIGGELLYSDSMGNLESLSSGDFIHINSKNGITYDIFNNGIDFLDIIEISLIPKDNIYFNGKYNTTPTLSKLIMNNPKKNQWIYAISSLNGLAPIKSSCDINIYYALLDTDKELILTIGKERQGYLFQCYGESEITTNTSHSITLAGSGSVHISNETIEVRANIPSNILLIETTIL